MAVVAEATAQSLNGENDLKKSSLGVQSSPNKKSHIREHPFMKEVSFHYSVIIIIFIRSLSVYYKWFKCFYSKCRYITQ